MLPVEDVACESGRSGGVPVLEVALPFANLLSACDRHPRVASWIEVAQADLQSRLDLDVDLAGVVLGRRA